jgi:uncharacterized protein (DUF2062 family)
MPYFPSTCIIVFKVSIGIKTILNIPAAADANNVLNPMGKFFVYSNSFSKCKMP